MAERLDLVDLVLVEGDPWRPGDANLMPDRTEDFDAAWNVAHRPDGTHKPPVPQAWAAFSWNGSTYTRTAGAGIGVTILGAGYIRVTLADAMRGSELWMAVVTPTGPELVAARELPAGKTDRVAEVRIETVTGAAQHASIVVEAYGERA